VTEIVIEKSKASGLVLNPHSLDAIVFDLGREINVMFNKLEIPEELVEEVVSMLELPSKITTYSLDIGYNVHMFSKICVGRLEESFFNAYEVSEKDVPEEIECIQIMKKKSDNIACREMLPYSDCDIVDVCVDSFNCVPVKKFVSELHPFNVDFPLKGGSKNRGIRISKRGKKGRRWDYNRDQNFRRKRVTYGDTSEVFYKGVGSGLPRQFNGICRAFKTNGLVPITAATFYNLLFVGDIFLGTNGCDTQVGVQLISKYANYRITGFGVDVAFANGEVDAISVVILPTAQENDLGVTTGSASKAEIQDMFGQRLSVDRLVSGLSGLNKWRYRKFYSTSLLNGQTEREWRANPNYVHSTGSTGYVATPRVNFGFLTTSGNILAGVGYKLCLEVYYELFDLLDV